MDYGVWSAACQSTGRCASGLREAAGTGAHGARRRLMRRLTPRVRLRDFLSRVLCLSLTHGLPQGEAWCFACPAPFAEKADFFLGLIDLR
jgi:hypothetical protein